MRVFFTSVTAMELIHCNNRLMRWRLGSWWGGWLCWIACGLASAQTAAPVVVPLDLQAKAPPVLLSTQARFWIDERGDQSIENMEVAADTLPWQVLQPDSRHRIDGKALWIYFEAAVRPDAAWFLEVGHYGIDRAQFFHRDTSGTWVRQETGDHLPVNAWPVPGRLASFALAREGDWTVRYWLRIEHSRIDYAAPLVLYSQSALLAQRENEQFLLGAYFGLACFIAFASLVSGLLYRDRCFQAYAVYVALLGSGQLARLGVGAQHLWPDALHWNATASVLLPGLTTAAALWFVKVVTEPARFSMKLDLATWALIAAVLAAVGTDVVVGSRASTGLVLVLTAATIVAIIALIGIAWRAGRDQEMHLIALGFLPLMLLALFPVARGLNLIPVSTLTRYGVVIGALLEMPILYYALNVRSNRRREGETRAAALSRSDPLTGLAHRAALLQRLETSLARARSQTQCCALLAARIANIDAILQEFGREAVDKALVVAASHLRRVATDIDLAARVGDNEFALLVETPTQAQSAMLRAQQLVADGLRHTPGLPAALTLKFHVVVILLPHGEMDAQRSLEWTLDGLQAMQPDARKLIRSLNF